MERNRSQMTTISIAMIASLVMLGTAYGFLAPMLSACDTKEYEEWMSGIRFILTQVFTFPVLVIMSIPIMGICRFPPPCIAFRHLFLLIPLFPTFAIIAFGGYCYTNTLSPIRHHLTSWQAGGLSLLALMIVLSFSIIGIFCFMSKSWERDRNFAAFVLVLELIFIAVSMLVSMCAITEAWP